MDDISSRLSATTQQAGRRPAKPLLTPEARARLKHQSAGAARALAPTFVLALAVGMFGWLITTAAAALQLGSGAEPLVVAFLVARWTLVAGLAVSLARVGVDLELRRWRGQPRAA